MPSHAGPFFIHLAQQLASSDLGARAVYGRADKI
jgi:hypothetical protein